MEPSLKAGMQGEAVDARRGQRYLFVSGCPRSGTTVLTTILNWSEEALVCQERFAPLVGRKPYLFTPELYRMPRILRFEKADCGYRSFQEAKGYSIWYANPKRFDDPGSYPVIGDKITHLFRRFAMLDSPAWEDEDVTLVHVVRNPGDVVNSYASRHADLGDAWDWDHERGIADWIESVEGAHALDASGRWDGRFVLVDYDAMFAGGVEQVERHSINLFARCRLEFGERQRAGIALVHEASEIFRRKRAMAGRVPDAILRGVPSGTMRKYHELREKCLPATEGRPDPPQEVNS